MTKSDDKINDLIDQISNSDDEKNISKIIQTILKLDTKILDEIDFAKEPGSKLLKEFMKCFCKPQIQKNKKCRKNLTNMLIMLVEKKIPLHAYFLECLQDCSSEFASAIGDIVVSIWFTLDISDRTSLEVLLLKHIIETTCLASTPQYHKNCINFLVQFKNKRRKKDLASVLVRLYQSILFKYFHAANALVRHNTLNLLGYVAFPLESPEFSTKKNEELMDLQIEELEKIMKDNSPKIRALAAKSICRIFYEYRQLFPNATVTNFLKVIFNDLCFDASSISVRQASLDGICYLATRLEWVDDIYRNLKVIAPLLHDHAEPVRVSFIKILLSLSQFKEVNIFSIIHLDHLIYRLQLDSPKIGGMICQLMYPSIFPDCKSQTSTKKTNLKRAAKCIFLCKRSLAAAQMFYSRLPEFVSIDEICVFLRVLFSWSYQTMENPETSPRLPPVKIRSASEYALPQFDETDDLERLGIKPEQAVWTVITASLETLSKAISDMEKMDEIKEKIFEEFSAKKVFKQLPDSHHSKFFNFLGMFNPTDDELEFTIKYLSEDHITAWEEALNCLKNWSSLDKFFPDQTEVIKENLSLSSNITPEQRSASLTKSIKYLLFMFSREEIREYILKEQEFFSCIKDILDNLNQMLQMLFIKLEINTFSPTNDQVQTVELLSDECFVSSIQLLVAIRVYISIKLLKDGDSAGSNSRLKEIIEKVLVPLMTDIYRKIPPDKLTDGSFPTKMLSTTMTLLTDMLILHIADSDSFTKITRFLLNTLREDQYTGDAKRLCYDCMTKIIACIAIDASFDPNSDQPGEKLLVELLHIVNDEDIITEYVNKLLETLTQSQQKKKCIPWIVNRYQDLSNDQEIPDSVRECITKCLSVLVENDE